MRIRLLAFASAGDALGSHELDLDLPEGSRVEDLRTRLNQDYPALEPLWPGLAVAVDGELAAPGHPLVEGAEVALLPPVSGGSGRPPKAALVETPIDVTSVARAVATPESGALLLFVGTVRNHHQGRPVERITYSAYRPMAERAMLRIVSELEEEIDGLQVAMVHRLGELAVGEASVVIAVASPHREAAYEASRQALERLKREVPIWKREHYADGQAAWREEESLVELAGGSSPG